MKFGIAISPFKRSAAAQTVRSDTRQPTVIASEKHSRYGAAAFSPHKNLTHCVPYSAQPSTDVNANSSSDSAMKHAAGAAGMQVSQAESSSSAPGELPHGMPTPLHSMVSAVAVQMTIVSAKTSNMPHSPCSPGERAAAEPCAIADEPSPASFENAPRRSPHCMACAVPKPPTPDTAVRGENAPATIARSAAGSACAWQHSTKSDSSRNSPAIEGTSRSAARPTPAAPPRRISHAVSVRMTPSHSRSRRGSSSGAIFSAAPATAPAALLICERLPMPKAESAASSAYISASGRNFSPSEPI